MRRLAEISIIFGLVFAILILVMMYKLHDQNKRLETLESCEIVEVILDEESENKVKICIYEVGD